MPHGRSQESRELRRHLLSHNGPSVAEWMTKSEYDDPVGLIETTDDIGKQRPEISQQSFKLHALPRFKFAQGAVSCAVSG